MSDLDALLQSLSGVENPNALPSFAAPAQPGMGPEEGEPAYEDALVRVAVAKQQREERIAAGTEPGYEDREETDEERNARLVMLRGLNPALEAYKLPVQFLDGCRAEYDVTEDWTVGELTAAVANSIGVLEAAPLFHVCQGVRTSNAVLSSTNYEKWLPRATTLAELGFTAKTAAATAAGAPLVFRMRWFKMPCDRLLDGNAALVHQLFLHAKRSLTAENVPLETDIAVRLAALFLQASYGDYDPAKIRPSMIASAPEGTYFSRSVQDAVGDLVKLEGLAYDAYSALRGTAPADAERRYLDIAQSTWCPLTGATVYMISGTTGVRRRTVVLGDGLAVELGTTLRFHPLKDIADVQLSPDRRTVAITVLTPFTAAQRPGDPQPREVMRFTTDEAPSIYELLAGYIALARPVLPPSAPDTTGLLPPLDDLPPPSLCDPAAPLRENILLEQSVAHAFCKRFAAQCAAHKVAPPPYVAALFRDALQSFPADGFNEYRFCKTHGVPSAAHLRDDFAVPSIGNDEFVDMQQEAASAAAASSSATSAPGTATTTTTTTPRLPFDVVRDLDLSNVTLKKGHLEALGDALSYVAPYMEKTGVPQNFVLRRLALHRNIAEEPEAVVRLLRAVCASAVPLARLAVRRVGLAARDVGDLLAAVLAAKQLEEVCVDHNPALGDEGFAALAGGLAADLPRLARLSCADCGVTGAGLAKLAGVLNRYKRPRALCLAGNDLGSKGAPARLAELLARCTPLEALDVRVRARQERRPRARAGAPRVHDAPPPRRRRQRRRRQARRAPRRARRRGHVLPQRRRLQRQQGRQEARPRAPRRAHVAQRAPHRPPPRRHRAPQGRRRRAPRRPRALPRRPPRVPQRQAPQGRPRDPRRAPRVLLQPPRPRPQRQHAPGRRARRLWLRPPRRSAPRAPRPLALHDQARRARRLLCRGRRQQQPPPPRAQRRPLVRQRPRRARRAPQHARVPHRHRRAPRPRRPAGRRRRVLPRPQQHRRALLHRPPRR